jgi:hypothetical protein
MTSAQAIAQANKLVGGGATSAMGPTMATMNLFYQGGYTASSLSSKNIMGSLAGISAMTGMTNEAAASSVAGINGMNFLRMGIQARNPDGSLKPIGTIINQVYNFLYRGQKITKDQAALVYNPGSKGYQTLAMVAAGDPALLQTLQAGVVARASAGSAKQFSTAMSSGDPNQMLNIMGVDQSSPLRSNFKFQTSQARVLQSTQAGLVGGYNTALGAASLANDGLANMANLLGPINTGLMNLKGILETLPQAGNVGGTLGGVAGAAAGFGKDYLKYRMLSKVLGGGTKAVAGKSLFKKLLTSSLGKKLLLGLGFIGGEVADPAGGGLVADAGISAVESAMESGYSGGGPSDHGNLGTGGSASTKSSGHANLPVPQGTPVTSPFGMRGGAANVKGNHPGVDFGVSVGSPVYALQDGTVTVTGNEAKGYGYWIEIDHGDKKTRYAHLKQILVSRGQAVKAGQMIAKSGSTGNSTGPHLHFEVLVNGKKVNPAPYLTGAAAPSPQSTSSGAPAASGKRSSRGINLQSNVITSPGDLSSTDINTVLSGISSTGNFSSLFGSSKAKNTGPNSSHSFVAGKYQETPGLILGTGSQQGWAKTLLSRLGKPVTQANIRALTTWAAWEGGQWHNSAHYNPLNTEQPEPGATNMNKEGVKSYGSWDQGYTATIQTLNNGRYGKILSALTAGNNSTAVLKAVNHSPWGTHIPGVGGPHGDIGTAAVLSTGGYHTSGGSTSLSSSSNVTIKLDMKVHIANASPNEAEKLVNMVGQKLKNSEALKTIARGL